MLKHKKSREKIVATARTFLVRSRLNAIVQSALSLQSIALATLLHEQMHAVNWAVRRIQAWWRGDKIRRIIREEKLEMLRDLKSVSHIYTYNLTVFSTDYRS